MYSMAQNPVGEVLFLFPRIYDLACIPDEAYRILLQYVDFSSTPLLISENFFQNQFTL